VSSSELLESPDIGNYHVQRCDTSRTVVVDSTTVISFTTTEYKLLLFLLSGKPIKDDDLVKDALGYTIGEWNRENLDKYIDKLRGKVRPTGLNVHRVAKYGYVLLAV